MCKAPSAKPARDGTRLLLLYIVSGPYTLFSTILSPTTKTRAGNSCLILLLLWSSMCQAPSAKPARDGTWLLLLYIVPGPYTLFSTILSPTTKTRAGNSCLILLLWSSMLSPLLASQTLIKQASLL